ncbi:MAG: sugar transferase [Actinomycetota bacterium]
MTTNGNVTERATSARRARPLSSQRSGATAASPSSSSVEPRARATDFNLPTRYLAIKYGASRLIAGILLVALVPVFSLVGALLRWKLGKGVIYRQARVGKDGESFEILKFRTMAPDRRVAGSDRRSAARSGEGDRRQTHKSDNDPRHNRLGRFLRKTSLDELPQLWNVVRGEMTLVGPRPELTEVVDKHNLRDHPRHVVVPGITGLWQVSPYRHELLHKHMHVDVDYVQQVSLRLDLRIIARTLLLVLKPSGR